MSKTKLSFFCIIFKGNTIIGKFLLMFYYTCCYPQKSHKLSKTIENSYGKIIFLSLNLLYKLKMIFLHFSKLNI